MGKKVLIIYAPYGSGHKSIAEKIENYFIENSDLEIKVLDVAKYSNILGKASIKLFDIVTKYSFHKTFSFIYDIADNKLASLSQMKLVKKLFDNERLRKEIVGFNPDLTISTHFFGGNIISYYNKIGLTNSLIMTVITDYASHSYWRKDHQSQDAFIVANEIMKNVMIKKGIDGKKIYPFGLPFDRQKMEMRASREETIFRYGLDKAKKTYLFFGGGAMGSMGSLDYLKALAWQNYPINIVFISGKNQKLEEKARRYVMKRKASNIKILGFTKDVYSLLNVSDLVISKPGGATLTECIDMRVPLILIPGNGGPEKYNAKYICRKKYGCKVLSAWGLARAVKKTLKNEKLVEKWRDNMQKHDKNESTKKILELALKMLKEKN